MRSNTDNSQTPLSHELVSFPVVEDKGTEQKDNYSRPGNADMVDVVLLEQDAAAVPQSCVKMVFAQRSDWACL